MNKGVYQLKNSKNGKIYIGSSQDLKTRESVHFSLLKSNKHHAKHLQNAWNIEDDKSVFTFEVIEKYDECDDFFLKEREQYYLDILGKAQEFINKENYEFSRITYNSKPIANRGFYGNHSEETKKKLSKCNPFQKEIILYDNLGNFITICKNGTEAMNLTNSSRSTILARCKYKKFILKSGFLVAFTEDKELLEELIRNSSKPIVYRVWNSGISTRGNFSNNSIKIKVIDSRTKEESIYNSLLEFSNKIGNKNSVGLVNYLKGKNKTDRLYKGIYNVFKI